MIFRRTLAGLLALLAFTASAAPVHSAFHLHVPVPPTPVPVAGQPQLIYELQLTNITEHPLTLRHVWITDDQGNALADWQGDALQARLGGPGANAYRDAPRDIVAGRLAVLFVELPVDAANLPRALSHRIEFDTQDNGQRIRASVVAPRVPVNTAPLPTLAPPLRGGPWAAVYHPDWPRGHRRVMLAVNGHARLPGRYAIDWIKLDDAGRYTRGDKDRVADWYGQGADVLAVADGVIVAARDDVAQSASIAANPHHPLGDASGNYVALDLGHGRYAFYEHLQPGSVRVRVGQRVRSGEVIAALGFTGHTTGPHLHFHVADANAPLDAEGAPYVFASFEWLGGFENLDKFGDIPWQPRDAALPAQRHGERPAPNSVVRFSP